MDIVPRWKSRFDLPFILNELGLLGRAAEIGTQRGVFAEHWRRSWNGEILYCVDPYLPYTGEPHTAEQHVANMAEAVNRLASTGRRFEMFLHPSSVAAAQMLDHAFDCVYIDADHSYEAVNADIEAWWPKVKPGGILAGHDCIKDGAHLPDQPFWLVDPGTPGSSLFGVSRAVHELFDDRGDVTVHYTSVSTDGGYQSWLVRKP